MSWCEGMTKEDAAHGRQPGKKEKEMGEGRGKWKEEQGRGRREERREIEEI